MKIIEQHNLAKPFVKWVGGKGQLIQQLKQNLPIELYNQRFTYFEPFVGGGAMLFFMLNNFPSIKRVYINDINQNLTETYKAIKHRPKELIYRLKHIEKQFLRIKDNNERKLFYLELRKRFNEENVSTIDKTSFFIFLNRTCFNGLYRENSNGKFNVPFGRYNNPTICNEELIFTDSEILNKFDVRIMNGDYKLTAQNVDEFGLNFFYFDPPYRPLSSTSSFNSYVKDVFDDDCQRGLANFCRHLNSKNNVLWMLSNSDCSAKNPSDTFFENLYDGFCIQRVYASRMVNSNASKRGKLTELLIKNYDYPLKKLRKQKHSDENLIITHQAI